MSKSVKAATERFLGAYNCSQAVLGTFCERYGLDEKTAFKLSEGFGLGMAGYKDECGALTGMFMTIGLDNSDGGMYEGKTKLDTYAKIKECGAAFEKEMGSIMCGEILKQEKELRANTPAEEVERVTSCGKNLICVKCVECAAAILAERLGDE